MPEGPAGEPPELSGLRVLRDPKEAFAARLILIQSARQSLDIQYYIWNDDLSGSLLLEQIAAAGDRGVKVRLLFDDNGIDGLDARLAMLNDHPNVEVRLYNPFPIRRFRAINWLFAFNRLNSRMHAKSLTADRGSTILGGRNIGDEYFDARSEGQFDDVDVLALGPVVGQVEQVFEAHWQHPEARPIDAVVGQISNRTRRGAARAMARSGSSVAARRYMEAIEALPLFADMHAGRHDLTWAPAHVLAAMPQPGADRETTNSTIDELLPLGLAKPVGELILISGYFVPTRLGCDQLIELRRSGSRVRVLTNSFAATDVGVVHAGYAPCRQPLLRHGVELLEMPAPDDAPKRGNKFVRSGSPRSRKYSGKSLHAKVYIVDRQQLYIGSANFDPRSAHINTELGLLIDSPVLAEQLAAAFETASWNSYRLSLAPDGSLLWTDPRDDCPEPEAVEPGTNIFNRWLIRVLSKLPIQGQL